ncbi:MAG: hypothetical protein K0U64_12605 [Actinomycetia bacterium]|nr:hypothetical protein [Actinomycetes bacterium]
MDSVGLNLATSHRDAGTINEISHAQAQQTDTLQDIAETVFVEISAGADGGDARDRLVGFAIDALLPSLAAESATYLTAASQIPPRGVLADAMRAELDAIAQLVDDLLEAQYPGEITAATGGLWSLYRAYSEQLARHVLPALAATPGVSLTTLFAEQQSLASVADES